MQISMRRREVGFSLVELLVSMAVSLIGIVVMMQVFALVEGQRRTTTDGSDAQINGVIGAFTLERDLKQAGFGVPLTGCGIINGSDSTRTPSDFSVSTTPIRVLHNSPAGTTNDRIEVLYSGADIGAVPATIQVALTDSASPLKVDSGFGFKSGQLVVLAEASKACTLLQLTQDSQPTGVANITASGTMWTLPHSEGAPFNPSSSHNIAPAGGYGVGAQLFNFDSFVNRAYYLSGNTLVMQDLRKDLGVANPVEVVNGVIALRAYYGRDTNNDGVVDSWDGTAPSTAKEVIAIRFAMVVRSGAYEKLAVTNVSSLALWEGGPSVDLRSDGEADLNNRDKHFRYKIYQTTVPLRNVIWGNSL